MKLLAAVLINISLRGSVFSLLRAKVVEMQIMLMLKRGTGRLI
jgi:hypothetical protein